MSPYTIYSFSNPSNFLGTKYETNCDTPEHLVYELLRLWLKKDIVFPTLPNFILPADLILKKEKGGLEYFSRAEMLDKDVNIVASNLLSISSENIPLFLSSFQTTMTDRIYFVREGEINLEMQDYMQSLLDEMEEEDGFTPEWVDYLSEHSCGSRYCDEECGVLSCGCIDVCRCCKYE